MDPCQVKPVISDLDCFVVGSRSVHYESLPVEQVEMLKWSVANIAELLQQAQREKSAHGTGGVTPWMKGWFGRLKLELEMGHHHPKGTGSLGYGDVTSCHIMAEAIRWTKDVGAVRHGAEAFNFRFPQDLDTEYFVTWDGFPGLKWRYLSEPALRDFLIARIEDGFAFPLNPKWVLCDPGWSRVWRALCDADGGSRIEPWFPSASGVRALIESVLHAYPSGYPVQGHATELADTSTLDLMLAELKAVERVEPKRRGMRKRMHARLSTVAGRFTFRGIAESRAATLIQAHTRRRITQLHNLPVMEALRRRRAVVKIQARQRGRAARTGRQRGRVFASVRHASAKAINRLEKLTGVDLDRDGDVGVDGHALNAQS